MGNVVCGNVSCKYKGENGGFCKLGDFIFLNQFGQCQIWFNKNGTPRMGPFYPEDLPSEEVITKEAKED